MLPLDYEKVITHHIQHSNYTEALEVLTKRASVILKLPEKELRTRFKPYADLFYKFSPALVKSCASETVQAWIAMGKHLQPNKLIPALIQCNQPVHSEQVRGGEEGRRGSAEQVQVGIGGGQMTGLSTQQPASQLTCSIVIVWQLTDFHVPQSQSQVSAAIRYLEFCVNELRNKERAIHNFLISSYATSKEQGSYSKLISYLIKQVRPHQSIDTTC